MPLNSKTLRIFFTREIWRRLSRCNTLTFCHILHHFRVTSLFLHFGPVLRTFLYYSIAFCSRPEGAGNAISGRFVGQLILDERVKFEPFSRNSTQSRWRRYFRLFFPYNFRPEVVNDVISGVAVDNVGMDVLKNLVIPGRTVYDIFAELISCQMNIAKAYFNSMKRRFV